MANYYFVVLHQDSYLVNTISGSSIDLFRNLFFNFFPVFVKRRGLRIGESCFDYAKLL